MANQSTANQSGNAYGLTTLIPIKNGTEAGESHASQVRRLLQTWSLDRNEHSPMARVPNTYLCRFYVLNDVFYQGSPAREEHLKSKYLVFSTNFHGELETYVRGMWDNVQTELRELLHHCVAFDRVNNASDFIDYIKRCQVDSALFFNGSTDDSLAEQLKALYLKQAFAHFVFSHQHLINRGADSAAELQKAFQAFIEYTQPELAEPTWQPGHEREPEGLAEAISNL